MPRERVAPQFEVIRAVMVDGSPYVPDKQGTQALPGAGPHVLNALSLARVE